MNTRKIKSKTFSVRVPERRWEVATQRAQSEGHTLNHVVNEFLEAYARGVLNLPHVSVSYTMPKK